MTLMIFMEDFKMYITINKRVHAVGTVIELAKILHFWVSPSPKDYFLRKPLCYNYDKLQPIAILFRRFQMKFPLYKLKPLSAASDETTSVLKIQQKYIIIPKEGDVQSD